MAIVVENQLKIHRWAVWLIGKKIARDLGVKHYVLSGSYRRGKWWCNDIDFVTPVNSDAEAKGLEARMLQIGWRPRLRSPSPEVFSKQYTKQINNKIIVLDLFMVPPGCWGNAMLFTTGPKSFNDKIRKNAINVGYSWANPRYFTHITSNVQISFNSEEGALKFMDLPWIKPKNRI